MVAMLLLALSCGEPRATAPEPTSSQSKNPGTNLLECPTDQTTTTSSIVGLLGGVVQLGATSISIPAGALLAPTPIRVTIPASTYMEIDVTALDVVTGVPLQFQIDRVPVQVCPLLGATCKRLVFAISMIELEFNVSAPTPAVAVVPS